MMKQKLVRLLNAAIPFLLLMPVAYFCGSIIAGSWDWIGWNSEPAMAGKALLIMIWLIVGLGFTLRVF